MKTKLIGTFLLGIIFQPVMCLAQISPKVTKKWPAHIVYKMENILSKVNLSEDKQIKIGQKFFTEDSLANRNQANGEPVSKLQSYYSNDKVILKPILSSEEFDIYEYEIEKDNRFLVALKFATDLKLNTNQISKIRKQKDYLFAIPRATKQENIIFCNDKLTDILTKEQYVLLLQIVYRDQSIADAKKDWKKIEQLKLVSDKMSNNEYMAIENYHSLKNGLLDLESEKYDKKKLEALTSKIALQEPPILIRANILTAGEFKNNAFSSILKYEKSIKLTEIQIDTILAKYKQLEQIRFDNEEQSSTSKLPLKEPSEYDNIIKILSPEQIDIWLASKNKNEAIEISQNNWKKLEMEGLTNELNKENVVLEFSNYQLKVLIADEKTRMYNTSEYAFYRTDIEQEKPALLKKLDLIAGNKSEVIISKTALTW